jgi:hypothetical protein
VVAQTPDEVVERLLEPAMRAQSATVHLRMYVLLMPAVMDGGLHVGMTDCPARGFAMGRKRRAWRETESERREREFGERARRGSRQGVMKMKARSSPTILLSRSSPGVAGCRRCLRGRGDERMRERQNRERRRRKLEIASRR